MTNWYVSLVKLGEIINHPDPETTSLSMTTVFGENVITKKGLFQSGDLAIFIAPESILSRDPENPVVKDSGLNPGHKIKAKKLRGIFSNGMIVPASICFKPEELAEIPLETHVADRLDITKWEPGVELLKTKAGDTEEDLGYMPKYTDIESYPRYKYVFEEVCKDINVVVTLKIHGMNARFSYRDERLWVGSHNRIIKEAKPEETQSTWWKIAKEIDLEGKFRKLMEATGSNLERTVIYGEVYGAVQKGFNYSLKSGECAFRVFDTFDTALGRYNDWETTVTIAEIMGLETVPVLYQGKYDPLLFEHLRSGPDPLGKTHIREGFVIKPVMEKHVRNLGRVVGKYVSEDYKLKQQ